MNLLTYETSQNMLDLLDVEDVKIQNIPLSQALGRVLAQDIVASYNDPQFPTASMDGYAIKFEDQEREYLTLIGDNPAGNDEQRVLAEGECIKTFTGSKMPEGADTLIQIENVSVDTTKVIINEKVALGSSVRPIGEGYKAGDLLIKKGTKLGFAQIGVMAALNIVMVPVALKPRVAVIATGSEILDLGVTSKNPSQIRSSNNYTLAALFEQAGAEVIQLGVIGDDKEEIMDTFNNALSASDILVSTGGVSVGDYDFVKDIVPRIGAEVIYKGVAIKPGKHIMLAQRDSKYVISLPGFAYSSTVTAVLYVLPLLAKMLGKEKPYTMVEAKLNDDFKKRAGLTQFSACNISVLDGEYYVDFEGKKAGSSAILTNLLGESALMISGEEDTFLEKDTFVNVILLQDF
jgi:molybdopterin molybdotransferase